MNSKRSKAVQYGLTIGVGVGVAIGVALRNWPVGLGVGTAVGVLFALIFSRRRG